MITTNRTAIRRRLAVRRAANRPPWGGRKSGHRSIVAPLAATFAATLVLSVGMALAKAERARRVARARLSRDRQFALLPGEPLGEGLTRMALGQLDLAIGLLADEVGEMKPEQAVHETRKALKRLRALMRLLRDELGEHTAAHENAVLRSAGVRLATARDTEVMVGTLDELVRSHPGKLAHRSGVSRLRARLVAERDAAAALALGDSATRAEVLGDLRAARGRVAGWSLSDRDGTHAIEPSLKRVYRDGRNRREAALESGGDARSMHRWRKRVKDLRYAAEMLDRSDPHGSRKAARKKRRASAGKRRKGRKDSAYVHRLAHWADELGELLGEEHDLVMLAAQVRADPKPDGSHTAMPRGTRKVLLKLIARRRKRLRKEALRAGKRLYRRPPKKFVARVRTSYARAART